jgi:hypothetical protein
MPPGGGAPPNGIQWFERNRQYVYENITEAQRLATLAGGKPVMAYAWPRYHNSADPSERYTLVRKPELFLQLIYPMMLGAQHVAIWGAESAALQNSYYGAMQDYVDSELGPMVESYCTGNLSSLQPFTNLLPEN